MDTFDRMPNREDYLSAPPSHAPKVRMGKPGGKSHVRTEERLGSLTAAAGIVWAVYVLTKNFAGAFNFVGLTPGPLGVVAVGILVWLHAKWRRSVNRA